MSSFDAGTAPWLARLGNLRNAVRQEMVARQLAFHLPAPPARVLDVGCGQGTQALALASLGHHVTGLDSSTRMLEAFAQAREAAPEPVRARLDGVPGDVLTLPAALGEERAASYDVVCCHGVLMYLPEPGPALRSLAWACAPGGLVSVLARNGEALAMRPGLRGQWRRVLDALAEQDRPAPGYVNELGVPARADTVAGLQTGMSEVGLEPVGWYGVRIFSDGVDVETPLPDDPGEVTAMLDAEDAAGRRDPYRRVATLIHVLGRRPL